MGDRMSITVAMHEKSLAHIGQRLDALGLDLSVVTFDSGGMFSIGARSVPAAEVSADYMWLSSHASADGQQTVFDTVLACKSVDVLQTYNAGLDHPFYKQASDKGMRLCNSSAQGIAIAEYTLAQVLSVLHPVATQRDQQASRTWQRTPFREISKTRWLIVGYGPIGREIAKRVKAFEAEVSVVRRSPSSDANVDRFGTPSDLLSMLPDADVIVLACPLNDTTRGMADAAFFAAAKQGAILVNIARGGLIDEPALISALDADRLETAILDVFGTEPLPADDPMWSHPKIRLTPHTSFNGNGVQDRWDALFLDNIARYVRGESLINLVDPADL